MIKTSTTIWKAYSIVLKIKIHSDVIILFPEKKDPILKMGECKLGGL